MVRYTLGHRTGRLKGILTAAIPPRKPAIASGITIVKTRLAGVFDSSTLHSWSPRFRLHSPGDTVCSLLPWETLHLIRARRAVVLRTTALPPAGPPLPSPQVEPPRLLGLSLRRQQGRALLPILFILASHRLTGRHHHHHPRHRLCSLTAVIYPPRTRTRSLFPRHPTIPRR